MRAILHVERRDQPSYAANRAVSLCVDRSLASAALMTLDVAPDPHVNTNPNTMTAGAATLMFILDV